MLTGLIEPDDGQIEVDGKNIKKIIRNLQNSTGYVSQNIYLADDTILFNITLTKVGDKVDINRVNHLINILDLNKLIESKKIDFIQLLVKKVL